MAQLLVFGLLLAVCTVFALIWGGAPERIAAAIFLAGAALTWISLSPLVTRYTSLEVGSLIADVAMLAALTALALYADRFWTLWMAAIQGIQVISHGAGLTGSPQLNLTYAILSQVCCFPMLALLLLGTVRHRRRQARYGVDNSWSVSSRFGLPMTPKSAPPS